MGVLLRIILLGLLSIKGITFFFKSKHVGLKHIRWINLANQNLSNNRQGTILFSNRIHRLDFDKSSHTVGFYENSEASSHLEGSKSTQLIFELSQKY